MGIQFYKKAKSSRYYVILLLITLCNLFAESGLAQCTGCTATLNNYTSSSNYTFVAGLTCFTGTSTINNDVTFSSGASICVGTGATLSFGGNNYTFSSPSTAVNIDVYGTLNVNQNPTWAGNVNLIVHSGAVLNIPNTITLNGSVMNITNDGTFNAGILQFQQTGAVITITNTNSMHVTGTLNITNGNAYFKNTGSLTIDGNYNSNSTSTYVNCGTYYGKFNLNGGGKLINTGVFNTTQIDYGGSTSRVENYGRFNVAGSINLGGSGSVFYNEGITTFSAGQFQSDGNLQGPSDSSKRGYFVWSNKATMNSGTIGPNLNLRNPSTTSSQSTMFNNPGGMTWGANLTWGNSDPSNLPVADCPSADGTPAVPVLSQSTACTPVNLTALQPSYSNVTYEWWTGTSSSRTTQITSSLTSYSTAGTIYLWAKNVSSGVYSTSGAVLTVNPTPTITNVSPILKGTNVTLTGTLGTPAAINAWVSSNPAVATVTSGGVVTGLVAGSTIITYTNSGGCTATTTIVVYTKYSNTAVISGKETDPDLSNNSATVVPVPRPVASFSYPSSSYCATPSTTAVPTMDTYGVKGTFTATPAGLVINSSTGEINLGASAAGTYEVTNTVVAQGDYAANSAKTNVTVYALPVPTITGSGAACANSAGNIYSTESGMSNYNWSVSGGTITSGGTSTSNTATVTWGSAGTGTISVNYSNSNGCSASSSTSKIVTINALPTATISGTTSVCQNTAAPSITFTGAGGIAPYTFTYTINGGTAQTITTISGNSVSVTQPTTTTGTYSYALVSVKDNSSTTCSNDQSGSAVITVNALPVPTITGSGAACANSTGNVYTTESGMSSYNWTVSGGTITSGGTSTSNTATVTWGSAGTGTISVNYSNSNGCSASSSTSKIVTINALPTAAISGTTSVCQNTAAPSITFTGAGGIAPYTFTYKVNGGTAQTITTTSGNSVSVMQPTTTTGTYSYALVSVKDNSSTTCSNDQSGSAVITVNALPVPTITGSGAACANSTGNVYTTESGMSNYVWSVSGGTITSGGTSTSNTATVTWGSAGTGTISVNYSNSNGCSASSSTSKTVTINDKPTLTSISTPVALCAGTSLNPSGPTVSANGSVVFTEGWELESSVGSGIFNSLTVPYIVSYADNNKTLRYTATNGCGITTSNTVTLTVNPTPTGYNDNVTLDCTGTLSYDLQVNVDNTSKGGNAVASTFSWIVSSNSYVVGASASSGNTINQTLYNKSNSSQQVTYTVTPQATGIGTCNGTPFTITVTVPVCSSLSISKSADKTSINKAGDVINYTITVVNTGNADQNNVVVNDPYLGGSLSNPTKTGGDNDDILEKGETWTYTGTYTVAQADLDNNGKPLSNGKIHNTVSVTTTELPTAQTAFSDVTANATPSWTLSKITTAT
ncbi:PKD-like domain-containing protein, partial [Paludibacter sp.]|uniref:beta strand repeat-containing protein n=1 Tax=Paludibacter sp. TaxID=1898105 RepID=UPI001355A221|nr:DUF11 domain-containing protein [Paludibacter sp.]